MILIADFGILANLKISFETVKETCVRSENLRTRSKSPFALYLISLLYR